MTTQPDNLEIVHEGWLTKSPPSKSIWGARWRKRWFVLRHSGELPGQYLLCYYTDKNCRKMKGRIDLDQCEQVDAGLRFENRKQKYQHMFDVRTPKRTYYLAAETEEDMNKWVDCVCHVCGLKVYSNEDTSAYFENGDEESVAESPPVSPTSTASGPYIPISECISGKPLNSPDGLSHLLAMQQQLALRSETYDAPRKLHPAQLELHNSTCNTPPLQSPATDGESVFTDEEWIKPNVNWNTFPRPSDSSADGEGPPPGSLVIVSKCFTRTVGEGDGAPPRPPKPSHLVTSENSHNYMNLDEITTETNEENKSAINDEMYDFPRSHNLDGEAGDLPIPQARHCYSNAAPGKVNGDVFRYDLASTLQLTSQEDANSPTASDTSSTHQYSNLPSPAVSLSTPPVVNRGLKPGRSHSSEPSPITGYPPSIDRKLKPLSTSRRPLDTNDDGLNKMLVLCQPPLRRLTDGSQSLRKIRAAPSPNPACQRRNSDSFQDEAYFHGLYAHKIQYLDLALGGSSNSVLSERTLPGSPTRFPSTIVYKTVDFLKTEAFNHTRKIVELERKTKPVH